jgi:hypothetical protein
MKALNVSLLGMLVIALISFTACQSENSSDATDETEESLAAAPTSDATAELTAERTNANDVPPAPTGPTTTISFEETTFNFGEVDDGEKVSHVYEFTNTGNEPLVISNAKGSCGCTVPKWPKTPIPPGETGEIMVEFNSKGKTGTQTKRVTITANTDPAQTFLTITGQVNKIETAGEEG